MNPLVARDTLTTELSRVSAWVHPCQLRSPPGSVFAVFDDPDAPSDRGFLGLVTARDIARYPDRIFADLVRSAATPAIDADCPLDEAERCFADHGIDALAVIDSGAFLGAITRESLFKSLLRRERILMLRTHALQQALETDRSQLACWADQLRTLHTISHGLLDMIAHAEDTHMVMQSAIDSLTRLIGARYGAIAVINEKGQLTRFLQTGVDDETAGRIGQLPAGAGLLGDVLSEQQTLRIENIENDHRFRGFPEHHPPMERLLAAPVAYRGRVLGRVYLCDKQDDTPFSHHDELLTVTFTNALAAILAHTEEQVKRQDAERHAGRLLRENQQLSRHLLTATEEERRYLARELHDEMGQCTSAIQAEAEAIAALSTDLDPRIHEGAKSISELGAHLYAVVHAMLRRLRPELLDDLGLSEAIRYTVRTWQARYQHIETHIHLAEGLDRTDETTAIVIYRIVQECLTNVSRHSDANAVTLRIARRRGSAGPRIDLLLRDNGHGEAPQQEGLGLIGLRERVESLGGYLRLDWQPWGMRLLAQIPMNIEE